MNLKRTLTSLLLLGGLVSGPAILAGCTPSSSDAPEQVAQTMPMGNMPDHTMMMDLGPKDAEFDLRFIDGMILHHQGAIVMAEAVLQNSQRAEMKQLAQDVIAAQQREIDQMQQWRQAWYPKASSDPVMYHQGPVGHTMAMSPEMQAAMRMDVDLGKADDEFDLRFLNAMIPHHEGALVMANQVLENSDRPELQQLAQDILSTQQTEIDQMQQWRRDWYSQ